MAGVALLAAQGHLHCLIPPGHHYEWEDHSPLTSQTAEEPNPMDSLTLAFGLIIHFMTSNQLPIFTCLPVSE